MRMFNEPTTLDINQNPLKQNFVSFHFSRFFRKKIPLIIYSLKESKNKDEEDSGTEKCATRTLSYLSSRI